MEEKSAVSVAKGVGLETAKPQRIDYLLQILALEFNQLPDFMAELAPLVIAQFTLVKRDIAGAIERLTEKLTAESLWTAFTKGHEDTGGIDLTMSAEMQAQAVGVLHQLSKMDARAHREHQVMQTQAPLELQFFIQYFFQQLVVKARAEIKALQKQQIILKKSLPLRIATAQNLAHNSTAKTGTMRAMTWAERQIHQLEMQIATAKESLNSFLRQENLFAAGRQELWQSVGK